MISILLRKIFLKIDIFRFKKLLKKLEKQNFDYILSDRYFFDSFINIVYLERHKEAKFPFKKLSSLKIPIPKIAFYLNTQPEVIMKRERTPNQGMEYLERKKTLYDSFALENKLTIIDGHRQPEVIFEEIKKLI